MARRLFYVQAFDGCGSGAPFGFGFVFGDYLGFKRRVAPNLQPPRGTLEMRQDKPMAVNPSGELTRVDDTRSFSHSQPAR